ncbi:MAG: hypothetical protein ABW061_14305 [Polyangiaceae bacterium]
MPDQPGKGPPSSAPLSVEDADRLADSFTPFWEVDGDLAPIAAGQPAAPVPSAPAPEATLAARKAINRQTLLGIAPIVGRPAVKQPGPLPDPVLVTQPMPAVAPVAAPVAVAPIAAPVAVAPMTAPVAVAPVTAPVATAPAPSGAITQPLPVVASAPPPAPAPLPHGKTVVGFVDPAPPARADSSPTSSPAPAVQSSPGVPGYAIAYTPKDGPSTPAVVIAPEAQSEPENRRPTPVTVASRVRAEPVAAPVHVQPSVALDDDDDFDPYAKKGKGKLIGVLLGGVAVVIVGVVAFRALNSGSAAPTTNSAPVAVHRDVQAAVTAPVEPAATVAAATSEPTAPEPTAPEPTAPEPAPIASATASAVIAAREPTRVVTKPSAARPKAEAVAATPTRPAARPSSNSSGSNAAPAKPASKGVIVRDAPF